MKYLFYSFILFLVVLQAVHQLPPLFFRNQDFSVWHYKVVTLANQVENNSALILGDSTGMSSFDPRLHQGRQWSNLSLPCGNTFEGHSMLQRLLKNNVTPAKVILSFHFESLTNIHNCFRNLTLNFNLFTAQELQPFISDPRFPEYARTKLPYLDFLSSKLYLLPEQLRRFQLTYYTEAISGDIRTDPEYNQARGYFTTGNIEEYPFLDIQGSYKKNLNTDGLVYDYLDRIISTLQKHKVVVEFVQPPYSSGYESFFEAGGFKLVDESLENLEKKYSNFKYYRKILYLPDSDFFDRIHPKPTVALIYSKWVRQMKSEKNRVGK